LACAGKQVRHAEFQLFCPHIFKKILQNLHIFDELLINFVSYVLGPAKIGGENFEKPISDNPETPNFRHFPA
jgi:hypothetical protein